MGVLTQNVRGFKTANRTQETWMDGWKRLVDGRKIQCIAAQEMHITSQAEAEQLERKWCRVWGRRPEAERPLTFTTITASKACGVAILLHPNQLDAGWRRHVDEADQGRCLLLDSPGLRLVNVYAPIKMADREHFFIWLNERLPRSTQRTLMLGDFNCVLDAARDRVRAGEWSPARSESRALSNLVRHHGMQDALEQHRAETPELRHLTYWQGATGARLDRGYITVKDRAWAVGVANVPPPSPTDHCGVVFWLRDPKTQPIQRALEPVAYPIPGRDADAIERQIGQALGQVLQAEARLSLGFDATIRLLKAELHKVRQGERRRARRQRRKHESRARRRIKTLADLIEYVQQRVQRRSHLRHQESILHRSGDSAHLFKRLVRIDQRKLVPSLHRTEATQLPPDATVADVMASEWQPLFGTRHATSSLENMPAACASLFAIPPNRQLQEEHCEALMTDITEEEIRLALLSLGAHKAAGPDRLGNDFYKDWSETLTPWLAKTFTALVRGGEPPGSFADALIVPIPKSGDPSVATNYRPISLLHSSYKVFTKILANRVQASLGQVINADQNGFVRGRAMDDNIHLMRAVLTQAERTPESTGAVVLVDFSKAYDSVDREFLWTVLAAFGYPPRFIELVQKLHEKTRARFLVNGELSKEFDIISGIRQGCPLAPLLFLIAAETLKYALEAVPAIEGISLNGVHGTHIHTLSAFVDDSAVFLRDYAMIVHLEDVLRRFGEVSGLRAQPHKSHAIVLDARYDAENLGSFPVVQRGATVPYLGVEIGLADLNAVNWERRLQKIEKRLGATSQYATGVRDRVHVINIACVPSLLFTAKHFPPSSATQTAIDALWRQYIWKGTIHQEPQRAHKIDRRIMELPRAMGGMGLRDYRGATLAQAATTLLRWNTHDHDKNWEAFRFRLDSERASGRGWYTYPQSSPRASTSALPATGRTWTTAHRHLNAILRIVYEHPSSLLAAKCALLADWTTPWTGIHWRTSSIGWLSVPEALVCRLEQLQTTTYAAMPAEIRSYWSESPWYRNEWVRDEHGKPLERRAFPCVQTDTIAMAKIRPISPGVFEFHNPSGDAFRLRTGSLRTLGCWLRYVVANMAVLQGDRIRPEERVHSCGPNVAFDKYEWRIGPDGSVQGHRLAEKWGTYPASDSPARLRARPGGWGKPLRFEACDEEPETQRDLHDLRSGEPVVLAGHPAFQHGPTLLPALRKNPGPAASMSTLTRVFIRPYYDRPLRGLYKLQDRLTTQRARDAQLSDGLHRTTWTDLATRTWGLSEYQRFFWYRFVLGAFNLRDLTGLPAGCPHPHCHNAEPATLTHIFWSCPGTLAFWTELLTGWCGPTLSATHTDEERRKYIFSRSSPPAKQEVEQIMRDAVTTPVDARTNQQRLWGCICTVAAHHTWHLRNEAVFRAVVIPAEGRTRSIWRAVENQLRPLLVRSHDTTDAGLPSFDSFWTALRSDSAPVRPVNTEARLYFDGGARGNPGIAGSGSVLMERAAGEAHWHIVWWSATYLGDAHTNNTAEHAALRSGLVECAARYANSNARVLIVGDSQLVLSQLVGYAQCKTPHLRRLLEQSSQLLRTLPLVQVRHTLREGNTMADYLANVAMDTRLSQRSDSDWTPTDEHLARLLSSDIVHPLTPVTAKPTSDLLDHTRRHIRQYEPTDAPPREHLPA